MYSPVRRYKDEPYNLERRVVLKKGRINYRQVV